MKIGIRPPLPPSFNNIHNAYTLILGEQPKEKREVGEDG